MFDTEPDLEAFRAEARAWLAANFPPSLSSRPEVAATAGGDVEADAERWRIAMGEKGWGTPTWPAPYGAGLEPAQAQVLAQELSRLGAQNPIGGMGTMMFGPTLLEYGNEEQKARHLPPIARGELRWCQGFSEPGAGSDLAGLQTRAEDRGDHFLVNGQKIWTSGAHHADWCFCLVRTDTTKKHEGISFVLIDMRTPGVDPRPIRLINGASHFCEVFFTDVVVPKENLVGPLNGGWTIAKRLLQHERKGLAAAAQAQRAEARASVPEMAKEYVGVDEQGRLADPDLRTRISQFDIDLRCFQLTNARVAAQARRGQEVNATTSILKQVGSFLRRDGAELIAELAGWRGIAWEGDEFTEAELADGHNLFYSKAGGIAGGSQEVQYNIIAKRILGLPDPTASA
ncbi:acyl-CoA dehydrogenase family protein [Phenylobacterium koreense]|uniref:Alkylation response protein AidB-like acyl-CoA dehydrogenase n=1 Tax=Phenylobacterium koreense TaxID=266125 RepID=A0ABV2EPJ5_9CAUL